MAGTWNGLGVPLNGEPQLYQVTAGNDIFTLTRITAGTGDYIVLEDADGTERVVVESDGDVNIRSGAHLNIGSVLGTAPTTSPTTGMVKGDIFVAWKTADLPSLGICTSTAAQTVKYVPAFATATLGRASAT